MGCILRDGVHFCIVGGRPIFLDLASDRYFCFGSPEENRAFMALVSRSEADFGPLDRHYKTGLLIQAAGIEVPQSCGEDCDGVQEVAPVSGNWRQALAFGAAFLKSRRDLQRRSARELLDRRPEALSLPMKSDLPHDLAARINGTIAQAALIFGTFDRCLPKALALSRLVLAHGYQPTIVFGVTGRPFSAHCWTRVGNVLLAESESRIRNYTPILAT
jgi:hypothetical protein